MSDLLQIVLTTAFTLIGGTLLFVFGEFVKVLVVVPLQKYKEQVQLTLDRVDFYANQVTNYFSEKPDDEEWALIKQISTELRSGATQLKSKYVVISMKKLLIKMRFIPTAENLQEAYGSLMFLSNSIPRKGRYEGEKDIIMLNHDAMEKVKAALAP